MRSRFVTVLNGFLLGSESLADLQNWLLSNLQTILDSGDSAAIEAANELDSDLIELGERLIDENVFIGRVERWVNKLQTVSVEMGVKEPT